MDLFSILHFKWQSLVLGDLRLDVSLGNFCLARVLLDAAARYREPIPFFVKCDQISYKEQFPVANVSNARTHPRLHIRSLTFHILL